MLKTIGAFSLFGICVVATIGLAGGGPVWFRYVGSGTVIMLLLTVLGHLLDITKKLDLLQGDTPGKGPTSIATDSDGHSVSSESIGSDARGLPN